MKSKLNSKIFVSLAGALLAGAFSIPAHAEVDCNKPGNGMETRACAKAAEGFDSLRRHVQRTQMIYQLDFNDYAKYVRQDDTVLTAQNRQDVAKR
jgi:hypothetical protein